MNITDLIKIVSGANVASAAYTPTAPYTGSLPATTIQMGSKGNETKALQKFLNWSMNAGLTVDGIAGEKTVKAIKDFQTRYGLEVDGIFGAKSKAKAKTVIASIKTPQEKMVAWAKKIASDNSWIYVHWKGSDIKTKRCPICYNYPKGKYHGWFCTRWVLAPWVHGAGLKKKCGYPPNNGKIEKIYNAKTDAEALRLARKYIGIKDIKVIRSKKNLNQSVLKAGDMCYYFKGNYCHHAWFYIGNGQMIDANSYKDKNRQIAIRKAMSCKVAIRYIGK